MGNCPSGYELSPSGQFMCVVHCDDAKGFDTRNINGEPYCVYRDRPEVKLLLKTVASIPARRPDDPIPTLESIKTSNPSLYNQYVAAKNDYDKKLPLVMSQIDKDLQIKDAFNALQTAENVRDQSPQAYQDARNRYYTLTKGDGWVDEEKTRIASAEANPKINQYTQMREDLTRRLNQQQQTIDITTAVKDKVLSMKDDFAYTTNAFSKQISDLKNQINIERKRSETVKVETFSWIDLLLNILLTVSAIAFLIAVISKYRKPSTPTMKPAYRSST